MPRADLLCSGARRPRAMGADEEVPMIELKDLVLNSNGSTSG
jgi:hypothetical protein